MPSSTLYSNRFAWFLEISKKSTLTITNDRADLSAFAGWYREKHGETLDPARLTMAECRMAG